MITYLLQEFVMKMKHVNACKALGTGHGTFQVLNKSQPVSLSCSSLQLPIKNQSGCISSASPPSLFFLFYQGFCCFDYALSLCCVINLSSLQYNLTTTTGRKQKPLMTSLHPTPTYCVSLQSSSQSCSVSLAGSIYFSPPTPLKIRVPQGFELGFIFILKSTLSINDLIYSHGLK